MIQRISAAHLGQLNAEQQEKLRSWWNPQEGEYIYISGQEEMVYYLNGVEKHKALPLLTIGQMMAYLREHEENITIDNASKEWIVKFSNAELKAGELCDALWLAVMLVL